MMIIQIMVVGLVGALRLAAAEMDEQGQITAETKGQTTITMQTPETIRGEVLRLEQMKGANGRGTRVVLEVKTERGTIPVHLGPSWYLENQRLQIKPNDQVEVTGTRVTIQDKETLIASQVKKGDQVLQLRDQNGRPVWAGTGMGMSAMTAQQQKMMEQHQKMAAQMKASEAQLDKNLAEMNNSEGQAKINAMAAIINQLVKERKAMRENLAGLNEQNQAQRFGEQSSNEEEELGAGAPGSDTEDEELQEGDDSPDEHDCDADCNEEESEIEK